MRTALIADTFSVEEGTGIARYSREMLSGLLAKGLEVEPIAPSPPNLPFGLAINHALKMPYIVRSKASRFDLLHATSPITALAFPGLSRPKVVTYMDLMSLLCDDMSNASHARLFAPLFFRIGKFADRIIAISTQTKEELIAHVALPAKKITVVNLGVSDMFKHRPSENRGRYVIGYVGRLTTRKGLPYLIRAFSFFRAGHPETPAKLVLCGARSSGGADLIQLASELNLREFIDFSGSLTDQELVEAYNTFDALVLPSGREGFGLPILEAQRCGVPVIIREEARIPPEVSKCCLRASSEEDMAQKIYELLTNTELRQTIIEQGLEHSRQFTWERTVQETLKVYEETLS